MKDRIARAKSHTEKCNILIEQDLILKQEIKKHEETIKKLSECRYNLALQYETLTSEHLGYDYVKMPLQTLN